GRDGDEGAAPGVTRMIHRGDLLAALDRAVTRRVTVISAPPGSGKTSLLRAWADRSRTAHRVAWVSVPRAQQDAQQFWPSLRDAIREAVDPAAEPRTRTAAPGVDGGTLVDTIL